MTIANGIYEVHVQESADGFGAELKASIFGAGSATIEGNLEQKGTGSKGGTYDYAT